MSPRTRSDITRITGMAENFWTYQPEQAFLFVKGVCGTVGQYPALLHQHTAVANAALDTVGRLFREAFDDMWATAAADLAAEYDARFDKELRDWMRGAK